MTAIFNTLRYTKRAIEAGFTRKQAEFQAEEISKVSGIIESNLVTKSFLKEEFIQSGIIFSVLGLFLKH